MNLTIDTDLAVTALAVIETHPERHTQDNWRDDRDDRHRAEDFDDPLDEECGTAFCLAGWIVTLDRAKWAAKVDQYPIPLLKGDHVGEPEYCTCPPEARYCTCGNDMSVAEYAACRVGLDAIDADALFGPENRVEDLRAGVKALVNGEAVADAVHVSHVENHRTECTVCFPEGAEFDQAEEDE